MLNINKPKLVYTIITTVKKFQIVPYNFITVPAVLSLWENSIKTDENKLYDMSLLCEPRGATRNDIQ